MSIDLGKIKTICFIGIGGIGISALAKLALAKDYGVVGINDEESKDTLDPLRALGAKIILQKDMDGLPEADLYIYSDAWLYRGPEFLDEARERAPTLSYFEALGEFSKGYKVIAVAGTHGKTTTTAMVAEVLEEAGFDPTVIVGSFAKRYGSNFKAGKSEYFLVEADEYMRHFLYFSPYITVITNIEADHLDYYKDLEDIQDAFSKLIEKTEFALVSEESTRVLVREYRGTFVDYGKYIEAVPKLVVPGIHNRRNAACALGVASVLEIDKEIASRALSGFQGTWRRLELRGTTERGTIVYDDYAHHPTEIRASLAALRELYPNKKITVVFQPHLYSRTKALFNDFVTAFSDADTIKFLPIYYARESPDPEVSSERLAEALGSKASSYESFREAQEKVGEMNFGETDVFVTMGAGEAYKVGDFLLKP